MDTFLCGNEHRIDTHHYYLKAIIQGTRIPQLQVSSGDRRKTNEHYNRKLPSVLVHRVAYKSRKIIYKYEILEKSSIALLDSANVEEVLFLTGFITVQFFGELNLCK